MKPCYSENGIEVYQADCRDVLPLLDKVDHCITDPPYSAHVHGKQWIGHALTAEAAPRMSTAFTELGFDALSPELRCFISHEAARLAERWVLVFSDIEGIEGWRADVESAGLEYVRACIWDKVDSAPQFTGDRPANSAEAIVVAHPSGKKRWNGGGRRNVFRHPVNGEKGDKPHPSTKPLPLMVELIELFTDPGDLILDPFAGSGSTLVAAKELGRRAIGIELDPKHVATAIRRLKATAYKPRLLDASPAGTQMLLTDEGTR